MVVFQRTVKTSLGERRFLSSSSLRLDSLEGISLSLVWIATTVAESSLVGLAIVIKQDTCQLVLQCDFKGL